MNNINYIEKYLNYKELNRDKIWKPNSLEYLDNILNEAKRENVTSPQNKSNIDLILKGLESIYSKYRTSSQSRSNINLILKRLTDMYLNKTFLNININENKYTLLLTRTINRFYKQKTILDEDEYKEDNIVNIEKLNNHILEILSGIFKIELITDKNNPNLTFQFNNDYIYKSYFNVSYIPYGEGFASNMIAAHNKNPDISTNLFNGIVSIAQKDYYANAALIEINNYVYGNAANNPRQLLGNASISDVFDFPFSLKGIVHTSLVVGSSSFIHYRYPGLNRIIRDYSFTKKILIDFILEYTSGSIINRITGFGTEREKIVKSNLDRNPRYLIKYISEIFLVPGLYYYFKFGRPDLNNTFERYTFIQQYLSNFGLAMGVSFGGELISSIFTKSFIANYISNRRYEGELRLHNRDIKYIDPSEILEMEREMLEMQSRLEILEMQNNRNITSDIESDRESNGIINYSENNTESSLIESTATSSEDTSSSLMSNKRKGIDDIEVSKPYKKPKVLLQSIESIEDLIQDENLRNILLLNNINYCMPIDKDGDCFYNSVLSSPDIIDKIKSIIEPKSNDLVQELRDYIANSLRVFSTKNYPEEHPYYDILEIFKNVEDKDKFIEDIRKKGIWTNDTLDIILPLFSHIFGVPIDLYITGYTQKQSYGYPQNHSNDIIGLPLILERDINILINNESTSVDHYRLGIQNKKITSLDPLLILGRDTDIHLTTRAQIENNSLVNKFTSPVNKDTLIESENNKKRKLEHVVNCDLNVKDIPFKKRQSFR